MEDRIYRQWRRWRRIDRWTDRIILIFILGALAFIIAACTGQLKLAAGGMGGGAPDFDELCSINKDTVAWLSIKDTEIAHPVVQGRDNFEYLDKAFTGEYYAGGTLFLDADNQKDLSDAYNIIYGHHMAGGAMFGGLDRFLDRDYLKAHRKGLLQTPKRSWALLALGAGKYDAYDGRIFSPGDTIPEAAGKAGDPDPHILALSTCTDEMNDDRIVVFFEMIEGRDRT